MSGSMGWATGIEPGWPGLERSEAREGDKTRTPRGCLHSHSLLETLAGASRWSSPGHPSPTFFRQSDQYVRVAHRGERYNRAMTLAYGRRSAEPLSGQGFQGHLVRFARSRAVETWPPFL